MSHLPAPSSGQGPGGPSANSGTPAHNTQQPNHPPGTVPTASSQGGTAVQPLTPAAPATSTQPGNTSPAYFILPPWMQKGRIILHACGAFFTFAIATVGLSCAIYFGLKGLNLQRWSARNDSLQACLAMSTHSAYCNETIAAGVKPPPMTKRSIVNTVVGNVDMLLPAWLYFQSTAVKITATVLFTTTCAITAGIYTRPRMRPFAPVVSMARQVPADCGPEIVMPGWIATTSSSGQEAKETSGVRSLGVALLDVSEPCVSGNYVQRDDTADALGQAVGVFYYSDEEEDDSPRNHDTRVLTRVQCSLLRTTLRELEADLDLDAEYDPVNVEKQELLAELDSALFLELFADFHLAIGIPLPECLASAVKDPQNIGTIPGRRDVDISGFQLLPTTSLLGLMHDALDEYEKPGRWQGGGSKESSETQRDIITNLVRLYDPRPRTLLALDGNRVPWLTQDEARDAIYFADSVSNHANGRASEDSQGSEPRYRVPPSTHAASNIFSTVHSEPSMTRNELYRGVHETTPKKKPSAWRRALDRLNPRIRRRTLELEYPEIPGDHIRNPPLSMRRREYNPSGSSMDDADYELAGRTPPLSLAEHANPMQRVRGRILRNINGTGPDDKLRWGIPREEVVTAELKSKGHLSDESRAYMPSRIPHSPLELPELYQYSADVSTTSLPLRKVDGTV